MLLLSPSAIQYLPGLECGDDSVEISQAVSLQDKQVLQARRIFYIARSAGQKGCVNMLQLGLGWGDS